MATSPTGLIALDLDDRVEIVDGATLRLTGVTVVPAQTVTSGGRTSLAFNRAGDELATSTPSGEVRRWDPLSGREVAPLCGVAPSTTRDSAPIAYLPGGDLIVAAGSTLAELAPGTSVPVRQVDVVGAWAFTALAVDPSGDTLAVSWEASLSGEGGTVALVDPDDLAITDLPWPYGLATELRFGGDDTLYAATLRLALSGTLVVFDLATRWTVHAVDVASTPNDLVVLGDGGALAALVTGGLVRLRPDGTVTPRIELRGETPLTELADGTVLGVSAGRIVEIDPDEHSAVGTVVRVDGRPLVGLLDANAARLVVRGSAGGLSVIDTATLRPIGPDLVPTLPVDTFTHVALSPDGSTVAVTTAVTTEFIDVASGHSSLAPLPVGTLDRAAFSPDGRRLLVGARTGRPECSTSPAVPRSGRASSVPRLSSARRGATTARSITVRRFGRDTLILDGTTGADVSGPFSNLMALTFAPGGDTALAVGAELRIVDYAHRAPSCARSRGSAGCSGAGSSAAVGGSTGSPARGWSNCSTSTRGPGSDCPSGWRTTWSPTTASAPSSAPGSISAPSPAPSCSTSSNPTTG